MGDVDELYQELLKLPSFNRLGDLLLSRFNVFENLISALSMEENVALRTLEKLEAWRDPIDDWKNAMTTFAEDAERLIDSRKASSGESLECDDEAQLSLIVC